MEQGSRGNGEQLAQWRRINKVEVEVGFTSWPDAVGQFVRTNEAEDTFFISLTFFLSVPVVNICMYYTSNMHNMIISLFAMNMLKNQNKVFSCSI